MSAHPDAIAEACRHLSREWGDTGYAVESFDSVAIRDEDGRVDVAILSVVCRDGSRFKVAACQYGVPYDPDTLRPWHYVPGSYRGERGRFVPPAPLVAEIPR